MIVKLKNVDIVSHTYQGIVIDVGETYQLEERDNVVLAEDTQLQTDISDSKIEVYIDTTKVLDTDDAIDIIRDGEVVIQTANGITRSFIFDQNRNKWLSTETVVISGAKDHPGVSGFLKTYDALVFNNDYGYVMPWDGTIIAMSMSRKDSDNVTAQVYIDGQSNTAAITISNENGSVTNINQDFVAGDRLTFNITDGSANCPIVMAFIKWRKV